MFQIKLFRLKIGDIDDSVFIVQSGRLNVLINNSDGTTLSLKHVRRGESVTSLLSFIDVLAVRLIYHHLNKMNSHENSILIMIISTCRATKAYTNR